MSEPSAIVASDPVLIAVVPWGVRLVLGLVLGLLLSVVGGWAAVVGLQRWSRVGAGGRDEGVALPPSVMVGSVLLLGPLVVAWPVWLMMWAGWPLPGPGQLLVLAGALATVVGLLVRWGERREAMPMGGSCGSGGLVGSADFGGAGWVLVGLMALVTGLSGVYGLTSPTTDYDGLAIWSYRTRVLLEEGTLLSPSLMDPLRMVAMREHPYLLPVAEALWCVGGGGFSWVGQRAPHCLMVVGWVLMGLGAGQALGFGRGAWSLAVGVVLIGLPSALAGPWMESAREPLIGLLLGLATLHLTVWLRDARSGGSLLVGALAAVLAQQVKVEGTAGLAGFVAAVLVGVAFVDPWGSPEGRLRRGGALRALVLVGTIALPWQLLRSTVTVSYDLSTGLASGWGDRLGGMVTVGRLTAAELLARPELYGLSLPLAVVVSVWGWKLGGSGGNGGSWRGWVGAGAALLPALAVLGAVALVYVVRQEQLPAERNLTYSRRMFAVMPGLLVGLMALPGLVRRRG